MLLVRSCIKKVARLFEEPLADERHRCDALFGGCAKMLGFFRASVAATPNRLQLVLQPGSAIARESTLAMR